MQNRTCFTGHFPFCLVMGPLGQYGFGRKFPHTRSLTFAVVRRINLGPVLILEQSFLVLLVYF